MFPVPAPKSIDLLNSVFRPLLTAAFVSFSHTAHRYPTKRQATGAAKEKEAQAALIEAGNVRAGHRFAAAPLLGGTVGLDLAFDFL